MRQAKTFADLAEAKKQATAIATKLHQGESRLVPEASTAWFDLKHYVAVAGTVW